MKKRYLLKNKYIVKVIKKRKENKENSNFLNYLNLSNLRKILKILEDSNDFLQNLDYDCAHGSLIRQSITIVMTPYHLMVPN